MQRSTRTARQDADIEAPLKGVEDKVDPKYGPKGRYLNSQNFIIGLALCVLIFYGVITFLSSSSTPGNSPILDVNDIPRVMLNKEKNDKIHANQQTPPPDYKNLVSESDNGEITGYVRIPKFIQGDRRSELTGDDGKLHVIFSSGCNYFQHWQSELLLASALLANQHGRITRIVSGCFDKAAEKAHHKHQTFPGGVNDLLVPVSELNRSVNENFGLFITPAFEGAIDFPWINKPSSIKYFMEHARPELDRIGETIIAIIDPDFIFMKPLTQLGEAKEDILATRGTESDRTNGDPIDVAVKGRPVSQRYGLEGHWVDKFKPIERITGNPDSPAKQWTSRLAAKYTSVGPPMILHIDDIAELSVLWERNMRPVLEVAGPDILADMYAYSIGAADLDLKHTTLDHYMISAWGGSGQAYSFLDDIQTMSCNNPKDTTKLKTVSGNKLHLPVFIHLASNFKAIDENNVEWMFHKGHVPAKILDCDTPLIIESPDNLFNLARSKTREDYQKAWVVCNTVSVFNRVLMLYKQKFCGADYEKRQLVRLIQHKTVDRGCNQIKDKWCYPLAQIEGLEKNWRDNI